MFFWNGAKTKYASKLVKMFPKHTIYFEPFFGTGSIYLANVKSNTGIHTAYLNDINGEIINLFLILRDRKEELLDVLEQIPMDKNVMEYLSRASMDGVSDVERASYFLVLNNYMYYGHFVLNPYSKKREKLLEKIRELDSRLFEKAVFTSLDYRNFFISLKNYVKLNTAFAFIDPPYLGTVQKNYDNWSLKDILDLFSILSALNVNKFLVTLGDVDILLSKYLSKNGYIATKINDELTVVTNYIPEIDYEEEGGENE